MASASIQFDNCAIVTSRVNRNNGTVKAVWVLEGLDKPENLDLLISGAELNMEIGNKDAKYHSHLVFFLRREFVRETDSNVLQIKVRMVQSASKVSVPFDVEISSIFESTPVYSLTKSIVQLRTGGRVRDVASIALGKEAISETYSVGVAVTPITCNEVRVPKLLEEVYKCYPSVGTGLLSSLETLSENSGHLYLEGEDNFTDVKLKSEDEFVISAHKFILVARCPLFRDVIEKAEKQNGFDGTVLVPSVNAKPLMALLHWMYTGKLSKGTEKFMAELVNAAVKYELTDLVDILDKKLINICNEDNMLQLFQTAKQNGMETAVKQISAFIREHI